MKASVAACVLALAASATAGPAKPSPLNFFSLNKRASLPVPKSTGSETFSAPKEITGTFDGELKTFGRGVSCTGQAEGGDSDAVFILKDGATLKNAIIGKDQIEGVHCEGACTIENVWWVAVCEDALTIKGDGNALVSGGGAQGAEGTYCSQSREQRRRQQRVANIQQVVQHNGKGTVTIDGFTVDTFGKLYRACGNCKVSAERHAVIKNVKASNGKLLAGINSNFGDSVTIDSTTCASSVKVICEEFEGTTPGNEPKKISTGPSKACGYTDPVPAC